MSWMDRPLRKFSEKEQDTWRMLYERQTPLRSQQIHPLFERGLDLLGFSPNQIPDLEETNQKLSRLTGFRGVVVDGLEGHEGFYTLLSQRQFPIGDFIRDQQDLNYTPAPDVFHDLYGHIPFYTDPLYADACQDIGQRVLKYRGQSKIIQQWERFFWFTFEFALIRRPEGLRIFGAGIASSYGECAYALDPIHGPEKVPFDIEAIRNQEFRIDQMQKKLFVLDSEAQLYSSMDSFERGLNKER